MRGWPLLVASQFLLAAAVAEPPVALRADHPMLGNWKFTTADGSCTETYLIRPDGTTIVTSGDEVSESIVEIADRPDADGWYSWTDKIVRNNGRRDCGGSVTPPGDVSTTFARFDTTGDRMMICFDKAATSCFGPVVRVRPARRP